MKILHVFKNYFPPTHGGIEHHINDVVHGLADEFRFVVLTTSGTRRGARDSDDGVEVVRAAEWVRVGTAPFAPSWPRVLRSSGADLIHFHLPDPWAELSYLTAASKVPAVATYHAEIERARPLVRAYAPIRRAFLSRMREIVVTSQRMGETVLEPQHQTRMVPIPFGIEVEEWAERPAAADAIRASSPGPLVAFVGRLVHYKGVDVLLEAMRRLDARLLVVGDGPLEERLRAQGVGLGAKVRFVGRVRNEERSAYYHAADVVVLPSVSRGEGFGVTMLEAMATGTPVVSTELGTGTSWVNVHGKTGLVAPARDPSALADALRQLLEEPARRAEMGAAARRRVEERFTKPRMLSDLRELYRRLGSR